MILPPLSGAGGDRVLLPGHLHGGDEPQDPGAGLRAPPGQLPQEHVEHHGLCRRRHGVSVERARFVQIKRRGTQHGFWILPLITYLIVDAVVSHFHSLDYKPHCWN